MSLGPDPDTNWRMSHELPAAGSGFLWPQLAFSSDGEAIRVNCRPSPILSREPVHYLSEFDVSVPAKDFERSVDDFIGLVLQRLGSLQTDLHTLWREVIAERGDAEQSASRKFEACLGYDADEAPAEVLQQLRELAQEAGENAADEVAPVCAGTDPIGRLEEVRYLASRPGINANVSVAHVGIRPNGTVLPWQRARELAADVRQALALGDRPLRDIDLAALLEISPNEFQRKPDGNLPMGLAVRTHDGHVNLHFQKKNRLARRFESARFIADYLSASKTDRWFPVANTATARQKMQRAFAAEFLCPIASLRDFLGEEFLPEAFEDAAEHFGISEMAVKSQLANHHLIPRAMVDSDTFL